MCSFRLCPGTLYALGFCKAHYNQRWRGEDLRPLRTAAAMNAWTVHTLDTADRSDCWLEWPWSSDKSDYPMTTTPDGKRIHLSRHVVLLETGSLPVYACHGCDTPPCWNPDHLYAGDAMTNAHDRERRSTYDRRGEANGGGGKLTSTDVLEIVRLYNAGDRSQQSIGDQFGVTQVMVGRIVRGQSWAHVTSPIGVLRGARRRFRPVAVRSTAPGTPATPD